ncbi:MAG: sigma 54-interacting transcriptional regulator [Bacteroidota bacterium]
MPPSWTSSRLVPTASEIATRSIARWGQPEAVRLIGTSRPLATALSRLRRFASADLPLVIAGESGVGKTECARAVHVLSPRASGPFIRIDCAQFVDEERLVAELVGVASGAPGAFERADGGTLLLDEVAALPHRAQAALLRVLDQQEVTRLGGAAPRPVDVRLIATVREDLRDLAVRGEVDEPLLNRLHRLRLHLPPLRERGEDWRLIAEAHLRDLSVSTGDRKVVAPGALDAAAGRTWPGNVHEVHAMVETAYWTARGPAIEKADLGAEPQASGDGVVRPPALDLGAKNVVGRALARMKSGEASFWSAVRDPYLDRELNRSEVRQIVRRALDSSAGSYKRALQMFGLEADEYLRFMDFLRHHRLKPARERVRASGERS